MGRGTRRRWFRRSSPAPEPAVTLVPDAPLLSDPGVHLGVESGPRPPLSPPEPAFDEAAALARLHDYVRVQVRTGVFEAVELRDLTLEAAAAETSDPEQADELARTVLFEELHAWHEDAARWPARTDCDRLDDALASLGAEGLIVLAGEPDAESLAEATRIRGVGRGCVAYLVPDIWKAQDSGLLSLRILGPDGRAAPRRSALVTQVVDSLTVQGLLASAPAAGESVVVSIHWQRRPRS